MVTTVFNKVGNRGEQQVVLGTELAKVWQTRHGAVVVLNFANDSSRLQTSTLVMAIFLAACGGTPDETYVGTAPELPKPQRGLFPTMKISTPAEWGDQLPTVPEGYEIARVDMVVRLRKKR